VLRSEYGSSPLTEQLEEEEEEEEVHHGLPVVSKGSKKKKNPCVVCLREFGNLKAHLQKVRWILPKAFASVSCCGNELRATWLSVDQAGFVIAFCLQI